MGAGQLITRHAVRALPRAAVATALATVAVILGGCSGGTGNTGGEGGGGQNFVAGDGTVKLLPADRRSLPGALQGATVDGQRVDVAGFRGHVVVLNVWASWCAPCQKEAPELQRAYTELRPQGVRFLGIDVRESGTASALAFQRTYGVTYPSLYDAKGDYMLALRGVAAPNAIPTTIVRDAQGRIAGRVTGATTKTTLVELVHDVMSGRTGTT